MPAAFTMAGIKEAASMLSRNHVTRRPVRQAMKVTRSAINQALDAAEPRLERAAGDLEDLSRDALKALRKTSLSKLDDLNKGYGRLEKRVRKQISPLLSRHRVGKVALIAAGLAIVAFGVFRSSS
jgi:hypothetical protein